MTNTDDRMRALEERIALLEDRLAIAGLMASYGPAVDSGSAEAAAELWTADGSYDAGIVHFRSAEEIERMVRTEPHTGFIASGAAHLSTPPRIEIDGDTAVSYCYQQVMLRDVESDAFRAWRVSANRWEWQRTSEGWKVKRRVNRLLDGGEEARALFGEAFREK